MALTITNNIQSMGIQRRLAAANNTISKSIERLSSGMRINSAADGPADLIISEKLRAQIDGLEKAIRNVTTTKDILAVTDGALGQMQAVLSKLQKLALHAANSGVVSADQIAADQAEMDAGILALGRIMESTQYAGRKLLNNLRIGMTANGDQQTPANQVATGQTGTIPASREAYSNSIDAQAGNLGSLEPEPIIRKSPLDGDGRLATGKTFTVIDGPEGTDALQFPAGSSLADIVAKMREIVVPEGGEGEDGAAEGEAGKTAPVIRNGADADTVELDMNAVAHIQSLDDEQAAAFLADFVNAEQAGSGLKLSGTAIKSDRFERLRDISDSLNGMTLGTLGGVDVTGRFRLDGREETLFLSLADVMGGGVASLANDPVAAMKIVKQAMKDVSALRAKIAAEQIYSVQAGENVMRAQHAALVKTESDIRDADMAREIATYTKAQVISQASTQLLAQSNLNGRLVLNLLA